MSQLKEVELVSTGVYLPGDPIPFDKIEDVLGHLDQAPARTQKLNSKLRAMAKNIIGIEHCHYAIDPATGRTNETNTSMAVKAIKQGLQRAEMKAADLEAIVLAGAYPDSVMPPTTALIQQELGIESCVEMEIHSNCTGITKAFQVAFDMLRIGRCKTAAVVYSQLSSIYFLASYYNQEQVKMENILLRWFLSDAASMAILRAKDTVAKGIKIKDIYNESIGGKLKAAMWLPLGASNPNLLEAYKNGKHHYGQDYTAVNDLAPDLAINGFIKMMGKFNMGLNEIDHLLIPIPSTRLFKKCQEIGENKHGFPLKKWFNNIPKKGYGGGAAMLVGLDEMIQEKMFKPREKLASFTIESSKWMVGGLVIEYL